MHFNSLKFLLENNDEIEPGGLENDLYINQVDIDNYIIPSVIKFINSKIKRINASNEKDGYFTLANLNSLFKVPFSIGKFGRCYISPAQLKKDAIQKKAQLVATYQNTKSFRFCLFLYINKKRLLISLTNLLRQVPVKIILNFYF